MADQPAQLTKFQRIVTRWMTPGEAREKAESMGLDEQVVEFIVNSFENAVANMEDYLDKREHLEYQDKMSDERGRILFGQSWEHQFEMLAEVMGIDYDSNPEREAEVERVYCEFFDELRMSRTRHHGARRRPKPARGRKTFRAKTMTVEWEKPRASRFEAFGPMFSDGQRNSATAIIERALVDTPLDNWFVNERQVRIMFKRWLVPRDLIESLERVLGPARFDWRKNV